MPTVTVFTDMNPQPRAQILIDESELDPDTETLTVLQISEDGEREVRDAIRVPAAGGVLRTDYEIPPGIDVTYQARQYDENGIDLGLTGSDTVQVTLEPGWAIISDPLAPSSAIMLRCLKGFAGQLTRTRPVQLHRAGRDTVALMGELGLLSDVNLSVFTFTDDEVEALHDVLDAGVVLIRTAPPMPLPRALYASIATLPRTPVRAYDERARWPLVGNEVTRSRLGVLEPVITYGDYKAWLDALSITTYGASKSLWTTYLDSKLNPPPEA